MTNASSDYLENRIIETYLRGNVHSSSPLWISLHSDNPTEGTDAKYELSGNGYKRASASGTDLSPIYLNEGGALPNTNVNNWIIASGSAKNNKLINFSTATGTWTASRYIALCSGSDSTVSGSTIYFYGQTGTDIDIYNNWIYSIPEKSIEISLLGSYSVYLGNNVLSQYLNNASVYQPSSNVEIALFSTLPDEYNNNGVEIPLYNGGAATGYSRRNMAGTVKWAAPTGGSTVTTNDINWGTATADWGVVRGVCIYESVFGNLLLRAYLNNPRDVLIGDSFVFSSGSIKVLLT